MRTWGDHRLQTALSAGACECPYELAHSETGWKQKERLTQTVVPRRWRGGTTELAEEPYGAR